MAMSTGKLEFGCNELNSLANMPVPARNIEMIWPLKKLKKRFAHSFISKEHWALVQLGKDYRISPTIRRPGVNYGFKACMPQVSVYLMVQFRQDTS